MMYDFRRAAQRRLDFIEQYYPCREPLDDSPEEEEDPEEEEGEEE